MSDDPYAKIARRVESDDPYAGIARRATPTTADTVEDAGKQLVYGFNRGVNSLIGLPGWLMAGGAELVGVPKETADKLRFQNNPVSDYLTAGEAPKTTAGRYADAVGQNLPAAVAVTGGFLNAARSVPQVTAATRPLANTARARIADDLVAPYVARPTAAVATDAAATVGASAGQQAAEDAGFGATGQMIGALGGGIVPIAGAQAVGSGVRAVNRATYNIRNPREGANERFLANLGDTTLDDLSSNVAVGATRENETINRMTLDILGDEMVRANGNQRQAMANTVNRIVNETGVTPGTAQERIRRLAGVHSDSDLMLGEYPAVVSGNAETRLMRPQNIDDADAGRIQGSGVHDLFDYLGNTGSGQSTQNVRNSIMERMAMLRDSLRTRLLEISPNQQTIQDADNLIARMTQQARNEYDAVYNAPGGTAVDYGMLHGLWQRAAARALNRAAGRGGDEAKIIRDAVDNLYWTVPGDETAARTIGQAKDDMLATRRSLVEDQLRQLRRQMQVTRDPVQRENIRAQIWAVEDQARTQLRASEDTIRANQDAAKGGQRILMPSLQQAQDMRGRIRGMITKARTAGDTNIVNALQPLYDDLTRAMERASPRWRVANRRWADMRIAETARELGEAFAERAGPRYREQMREFDRLAPEMQDLVRIELAQKWIDKIDNAGDTHDLAKLFSTPHIRAVVRRMFGDQAAVDFARAIRDQRVATISRGKLANSATHRRGMNQAEQDAEVGMVANLDAANIGGVRNWLIEALTNVLRERRNRPLADIVTTPMSNTPQVAERLSRLRNTQARLQRFNRPRVPTSGIPATFGALASPEEE